MKEVGEVPACENVFGEFINEESPIDTAKFPSLDLDMEPDIKVPIINPVSPPETARLKNMAAAFNSRILKANN